MSLRGWSAPVPGEVVKRGPGRPPKVPGQPKGQYQRNQRDEPMKRTSRDTFLPCPVCNRPCQGPQGVAAHVRSAHLEHYLEFGTNAPPPKERKNGRGRTEAVTPTVFVKDTYTPEASHVTESPSPIDLLDDAIRGLKGRVVEINKGIAQLQELQQERTIVETRLNALTEARKAFESAVPAGTEAVEQRVE